MCQPYFPSILRDAEGVDKKRERLEWLIHIWIFYHTHTLARCTHTPEDSSEARASHMPLVVLAEYSILQFVETTDSAVVGSLTPCPDHGQCRGQRFTFPPLLVRSMLIIISAHLSVDKPKQKTH